FGIPVIVAINHFVSDTEEEIQIVKDHCAALGFQAITTKVWAEGGNGAIELAQAVTTAVESQAQSTFTPLYSWDTPVEEKIHTIATKIYGADGVTYSQKAKLNLKRIKRLELENLAICVAKTQKSLSDDPRKIGRPKDFKINVREIEIAAGAGFLIPITGDIMRMPGLPAIPSAEHIDIDDQGQITGLF
ncbi:MAG: formate--tetrahydrofolate ligase, partial [Bacteroidota bacterium]